jgi:sarcosine oxidase/L-pipecolate oxidase
MTNPSGKTAKVLIVGAGTWGTAIAYRLATRGYKCISVLDSNEFPSCIAAGNDVNKILEERMLYPRFKLTALLQIPANTISKLTSDSTALQPPSSTQTDREYVWNYIEALSTDTWLTDPTYNPHYHSTGFIYAAVSDQAYAKVLAEVDGQETVYSPLTNAEELRSTMPVGVLTGEFPGWRGFWRRKGAGWVEARRTMEDIFAKCEEMGVTFTCGSSKGRVQSLLHNAARTDIIGATTFDGTPHLADITILAAGANSDGLLDFEKQLRPTAWTLAHVPLTDEEAKIYKNLSVLYGVDRGFFIEPDIEKGELKVCDEHPGYINLVLDEDAGEEKSVPFAKQQIPLEAEKRMRSFLREAMPHLAERKFTFARICWDADTMDRLFLIDRHPQLKSLVVAAGGSGHGFMCSPAVGTLVAELLEEKMDERVKRMVRWRPELAVNRDWWDTQGRFGGDGCVMSFGHIEGWTEIGERQKK